MGCVKRPSNKRILRYRSTSVFSSQYIRRRTSDLRARGAISGGEEKVSSHLSALKVHSHRANVYGNMSFDSNIDQPPLNVNIAFNLTTTRVITESCSRSLSLGVNEPC